MECSGMPPMFKQGTVLTDGPPALSARDFERFRRLAYEKVGLNLTEAKHDLMAARLGKKLRELRLASFSEYYEHVVTDRTGESLIGLIDALSTNHTSFLREASHFLFLRQTLLPRLRARPAIHIWSAPCSTGEEAYSIAITLLEELGVPPRPEVRIRAVDVSTRAIASAKKGIYAAERLGALPFPLIKKYFQPAGSGGFQVKPEVRRVVEFARVNLVEPLAEMRVYPLIFCRNMMIYLDKPTQERLISQLTQFIEPGGYLFI